MWCLWCGRHWSVCEVVLIPCVVGAVVAFTVMRVLLFVCEVSILRECEGDKNAGVGAWGVVVAVSVRHEYMGSTRGSGVVSNADDVQEMSVVRRVRGGVCEMCMCLARDGVGGEWVK